MDKNARSLLSGLRYCIQVGNHAGAVQLMRQLLEPMGVPPPTRRKPIGFTREGAAEVGNFWGALLKGTRMDLVPSGLRLTPNQVRERCVMLYGTVKLASDEFDVLSDLVMVSKISSEILMICDKMLPERGKREAFDFGEDGELPVLDMAEPPPPAANSQEPARPQLALKVVAGKEFVPRPKREPIFNELT